MDVKRVIDLARDFAERLSEMTAEFGQQTNGVVGSSLVADPPRVFEEVAKVALVTTLIEQRRLRQRFLPRHLFQESAWDMLLVLYLCRQEKRVIYVTALTASVATPQTTSQRWLDHLTRLGLVHRAADADDRRRIGVSLSDDVGLSTVNEYLDAIK